MPSRCTSTSAVACASASARWHGRTVVSNRSASVPRFIRGRRPSRSRRASATVSITGAASRRPSSRDSSASTKPTSKRALWATSTAPSANSRNCGSALAIRGAPRRSRVWIPVMRVIVDGTGTPGSTSRSSSPTCSNPCKRTAPISTIRDTPGRVPVVSRSNTTNGACSSGRSYRVATSSHSASATSVGDRQTSRRSLRTTSSTSWWTRAEGGAPRSANRLEAASAMARGARRSASRATSRSAPSSESWAAGAVMRTYVRTWGGCSLRRKAGRRPHDRWRRCLTHHARRASTGRRACARDLRWPELRLDGGLQLAARRELRHLAGRDHHFLARVTRVDTGAGLAVLHRELSETGEDNVVTLGKRVLDGLEHGVDRSTGVLLGQVRSGRNRVDEIALRHPYSSWSFRGPEWVNQATLARPSDVNNPLQQRDFTRSRRRCRLRAENWYRAL